VPPVITRGGVSVCTCGATYVGDRMAVFADLEALPDGDVQALRQQRARVAPHVKKARTA
jgi:hypothetical protein